MKNGLALKGATLIAVGALGLLGMGALGPVFNPRTASADDAVPSWQRPAIVQPASTKDGSSDGAGGDGFRERIAEMMKDHMGITGDQANEWAGTMEDMMRSMHGDQADEMLRDCAENGGSGGMMGGWGGN